jgi:8-oxo-dGTP diphosphatase
MAAGVLIRDRAGRVLLVEPACKDYWEIPGGCVEAGESPYAAAVRELKEELNISVVPGRIQLSDGELRSWAWSTAAEAEARLSDLLARRVQSARQAASERVTTCMEDGDPVG